MPSDVEKRFDAFTSRVGLFEAGLQRDARDSSLRRFVHSSSGMETAPFLVAECREPDTRYCLYYRCHAWLLALGGEPDLVRRAVLGGTPISPMQPMMSGLPVDFISVTVGAQLPVALGLALAGRPTVAAFGDGALSTGVVFETMNSAAIHRPDLLFVLDDNHRAVSTAGSSVAAADPARLCECLGLGYLAVEGGDSASFSDAISWLRATAKVSRFLHVRSPGAEPHCLAMTGDPSVR
jgi:TPP-dependent pyruvate/acetoin dehydrogenase alpha subunit